MPGMRMLLAGLLTATTVAQTGPNIFEDDEVRITIPPGWSRATGNSPSIEPYRVNGAVLAGNSASEAQAKLFLQKDGYTLALAYRTMHASGVDGGRFIEAFEIPWLKPDQAWGPCSGVLSFIAQPASRTLLFENIVFETGSPKVREQCGIPKGMGESVGEGLQRRFLGERRWYGGYFTDHPGNGGGGGFFFDEQYDETCHSKLYSLTTAAVKPEQLPAAEDPHLETIIQEAINIVNGIRYKRCAPKLSSPFR